MLSISYAGLFLEFQFCLMDPVVWQSYTILSFSISSNKQFMSLACVNWFTTTSRPSFPRTIDITGFSSGYRYLQRFHLKGVGRGRVVTFAAIRLRGPRFKPWPEQRLLTRLCVMLTPYSASGTTTSNTRASPRSGNTPSAKVKGRSNGCRYVGRKEETRMKSDGR